MRKEIRFHDLILITNESDVEPFEEQTQNLVQISEDLQSSKIEDGAKVSKCDSNRGNGCCGD